MKKTIFILALLTATLSFAQNSSNKNFSEFEQSLMNRNEAVEASTDSSSTTNSTNEFEEKLYTYTSSDEPILLARESLLEAIKQKDQNGIREKIAALDELGNPSTIPIDDIEKEWAYIELRMFEDYLNLLTTHYKTMYDTTKYDKDPRHISDKNDALVIFVTKKLEKLDTLHAFYYNIKNIVDSSDLSKHDKEKIEIMVLLRDAYRKKDVGEYMEKITKQFIEKYPDDPDVKWMEKCIYGPLEKLNLSTYSRKMRKVNKEHVIENKLYTGGLGFKIGFPVLGLPIGLDNLYRKDLYELDAEILNLELYLQIKRVVIFGEMINSGISGIWGYGFGAGFVAYDSRYLKITPYFSVTMTGVEFKAKKNIPGNGYLTDEWEYSGATDPNSYTFGANIDYKFGTAYLFLSDKKLVSFALTSKIGASYLDIDKACVKGTGVIVFAHIGLGIYFW